jgi:DMSO/TMAO reductase YedYZ heme-binding membrane subunit
VIAAVDPKVTWYISRSAGLTTWLLCGFAIVWGLVLSTKLIRRRGLPAWLLDLHTFLGTLALVFCGIHLAALAVDDYAQFGWSELFVPMSSPWKPGAVAWGIVSFYLLLAVQLTSWARKHLPKRVWHSVHLTSFALFGAGTVHGVTAGSDWTNQIVQWGSVAVVALVAVLTTIRFTAKRRKPKAARITARPPSTVSA